MLQRSPGLFARRPSLNIPMTKGRFEAFSDGVFAVAITLLVLEIHLPVLRESSNAELTAALWHLWPQILTYVVSFATIGVIWLNPHSMFHLIKKIDRNTLIINLLLLMVVCFIPFAAALLTTYGILRSGVFLYGGTFIAMSLIYNLLWHHAVPRAEAAGAYDGRARVIDTLRNLGGAIAYSVATLCAFLDPHISIVLFLVIVVFYLFPGQVDAVLKERGGHAPAAGDLAAHNKI